MANKWLVHVKKTMKRMKSMGTYKKGLGLKQVIMAAKKTWHSAKKGMHGGDGGTTGAEFVDVDLTTPSPPGKLNTGDAEAVNGALGGRRRTRRRRHGRRH